MQLWGWAPATGSVPKPLKIDNALTAEEIAAGRFTPEVMWKMSRAGGAVLSPDGTALPLPADRLQPRRKPRRDDPLGRGARHEGRHAPDRPHVEQPRAPLERRRAADLLPLGPQRLDAGLGDGARGRQRASAVGFRARRRGIRHLAPRRQGVVRTARAGGRPPLGRHPQGHGQVEGPDLRRPDGPPLGLLGRGRIPAPLRRRLRARRA